MTSLTIDSMHDAVDQSELVYEELVSKLFLEGEAINESVVHGEEQGVN